MWQVFKKDFSGFIATYTGLVVGVVFLLISALFLWLMEGSYNILYSGLAELTPFFELVPWLFIFIIPAISMRSLSEEYRSGTLEILLTKPVTETKLVTGKLLAVWASVIIILIPAAVFIYSIYKLALPGYEPDSGVLVSSFTGLVLLSLLFSAAGVMVSSMTAHQMAAYLGSVFLIFLLYYGAYGLGSFDLFGRYDYFVQSLSFFTRYDHFIKGLVRLSDIFYLTGWSMIFLALSVYFVKKHKG
jgi:ABC-2 type transport system permease protein